MLASSTLALILSACGQSAAPSPTTASAASTSVPAQPTAAPTAAATASSPAAVPTTAAQPTAAATVASTGTAAPAGTAAATGALTPATTTGNVTYTPAKTTGPVTLRVAAGSTYTSWKGVWDQLVKAYQDANKQITVQLDPGATGANYDQKLFADIAAGTLPDIIYTTDNYAAPFKQNKITQDMLPFARQTNFPISDFNPTFLNLGMVDGQLHMLPASGDVVVLFINKKMVQQAGVQIPWQLDYKNNKIWTTDDFYKVCQQLTVDVKGKHGNEAGFDKNNVNVYGASVRIDWWAVYVPAIVSFGGQLVSDDLTKSLMNSPQGIEAFKWLTKPVLDGYWAPFSFLNTLSQTNGAIDAFNGGKAAITTTVHGSVPGIRPNIKDDWDVAHFYAGPAKRVTGMGTLGFAMSGTTKNPDVAWNFLEFMYDDPGQKIILSSYGASPVEKRFYNASFWRELPPPPANNSVFTDAYDYGILPPRLPFYTTGPFTKALGDGLTAIELGQAKVEDVVANVSNELQKWLDQNVKKS